MAKITKKLAKEGVTEILAILSNYSQERIIELIDYSDDTNLQLVALLSPKNKDVLAQRIRWEFNFSKQIQADLYKKLFEEIKTAESLIDYVFEMR
jgi:hypothetical protein